MNAVAHDDRRLDRLRWKARRGLLENDLLLSKFLEAELTHLNSAELDTLDALLQLGDNDLLDLLMGRNVPKPSPDAAFAVSSGVTSVGASELAIRAIVKRIQDASPQI